MGKNGNYAHQYAFDKILRDQYGSSAPLTTVALVYYLKWKHYLFPVLMR